MPLMCELLVEDEQGRGNAGCVAEARNKLPEKFFLPVKTDDCNNKDSIPVLTD